MNLIRSLFTPLLLGMLLLVSACSTVMTPKPLGEPRAIDREKFNGAWTIGEDVIQVQFAESGVGRIAWLDWKEGDFRTGRGEMIVVPGKANNFLSVRFDKDGKWTDEYQLASYTFTKDGDLVVWLADAAAFRRAVEGHQLAGKVDASDESTEVLLTDPPAKVLQFIDDPDNLKLFDYRKPMIFKRVGPKPEKAEPAEPDNTTK